MDIDPIDRAPSGSGLPTVLDLRPAERKGLELRPIVGYQESRILLDSSNVGATKALRGRGGTSFNAIRPGATSAYAPSALTRCRATLRPTAPYVQPRAGPTRQLSRWAPSSSLVVSGQPRRNGRSQTHESAPMQLSEVKT